MNDHPNLQVHTIRVRRYGGTYIARVLKTDCNASCTMGSKQAAEAVARKLMRGRPYKLRPVQGSQSELWLLSDYSLVPDEAVPASAIRDQASGEGGSQ